MGDQADLMLEGFCCCECGQDLDDDAGAAGVPRRCAECEAGDLPFDPGSSSAAKLACPGCTKKFPIEASLLQHRKAKGH